MVKKIIITVLILYVVVTSAYFLNKAFPFIDKIFSPIKRTTQTQPVAQKLNSECASYSLGHIAVDKFRINSRFFKSVEDPQIDENNLAETIAKNTCDRAGQTALIYYDSRPVAIASVESYDYSKPVAVETKEKPIVYSVMTIIKKLSDFPDNGYVVAVFDYDEKAMDFYNRLDTSSEKADDDLISGSVDTIYYQVIGQDPSKTEVEYSSLKTDLNTEGNKEIAVSAVWTDKRLPTGVHYVAAFNLHKTKESTKVNRYPLFPITKTKKANLYLFQVVDIDNDGYKETILRKEKNGIDTFLIYKYDPNKDAYAELVSNKETD
ncbi:MAG: hypothetical protein NTY22_03120 [Proteobacteria bacterium]|nr:hypothetical protein [Pseudomonadota bacterium]